MSRHGVTLVVASALLLGAACGEQASVTARSAAAETPIVLEISGGTEAEREAVHAALAPLDGVSRIREVRLGSPETYDADVVTLVVAGARPSERLEGAWQAELVARDLVERLRAAGASFRTIRIDGSSEGPPDNASLLRLPKSDRDLADLIERIRARAAEADLELRSVQGIQLPGTPAVATVVRLREDQPFDDKAHITCTPPVGADRVSVEGVLGGHEVDTGYDGCYTEPVALWERLLGVPPL